MKRECTGQPFTSNMEAVAQNHLLKVTSHLISFVCQGCLYALLLLSWCKLYRRPNIHSRGNCYIQSLMISCPSFVRSEGGVVIEDTMGLFSREGGGVAETLGSPHTGGGVVDDTMGLLMQKEGS